MNQQDRFLILGQIWAALLLYALCGYYTVYCASCIMYLSKWHHISPSTAVLAMFLTYLSSLYPPKAN